MSHNISKVAVVPMRAWCTSLMTADGVTGGSRSV
jgi:hypothetical protein